MIKTRCEQEDSHAYCGIVWKCWSSTSGNKDKFINIAFIRLSCVTFGICSIFALRDAAKKCFAACMFFITAWNFKVKVSGAALGLNMQYRPTRFSLLLTKRSWQASVHNDDLSSSQQAACLRIHCSADAHHQVCQSLSADRSTSALAASATASTVVLTIQSIDFSEQIFVCFRSVCS